MNKKFMYKTVIAFALLNLICLNNVFAAMPLYTIKTGVFQINNISKDIEEIEYVELEKDYNYEKHSNEYIIETVPLFEEKTLSVFDKDYSHIDHKYTINEHIVVPYVLHTTYNYKCGKYYSDETFSTTNSFYVAGENSRNNLNN